MSRVDDQSECPSHGTGVVAPPAGPTVQTENKPRARLGDFLKCGSGPDDVIMEGAVMVRANDLPVARVGDKTHHKARLKTGSPTTSADGPTFSLPDIFEMEGPPDFLQKLVRDLFLLWTLPSGRDLIQRLADAGQTIKFIPFNGPNSFAAPNWPLLARWGIPTGSTIQYNPDLNIRVYDRAGNVIEEPPQIVLGHEMAHALANSTGTHRYEVDPSPPASEPTIAREEAQAIGTGSHTTMSPSENSLRRDLGLPERDNHLGFFPPAGTPPPPSIRPGGP